MEYQATATFEGKPLSVLNDLIKLRSQALKESVRDATAAVGINALTSIRTTTLDARKKKKFEIKVEDTGWYAGFSKTLNTMCVRDGISPYSKRIDGLKKVVYLTHGITKQANRHVYRVTQEKTQIEPFYVACATSQIAMDYALKATKHRINDYGTLAKNALGVAMHKLAGTSKLEGSGKSQASASKVSRVDVHDGDGDYSVTITDELDYATDAVNGGESAIQTALMKAANKVAGTLKHFASSDLKDSLGTPFPEVKKRK